MNNIDELQGAVDDWNDDTGDKLTVQEIINDVDRYQVVSMQLKQNYGIPFADLFPWKQPKAADRDNGLDIVDFVQDGKEQGQILLVQSS